ncbi:MAG: peptidoglycan DD-metalloendopeptidase family protein [Oscillospiraceae bacterium]|nr:peptidoglycan DD-metalloendopeptidase family protein [Oscillospiraceae bacterium]
MKRIAALCLTIIMVMAMFPIGGASAQTMAELLEEKRLLSEKITKKNSELAAIKDEVRRSAVILEQYEERLAEIHECLELTRLIIEEIKISLAAAQESLDAKERELKERYVILGKRIRYLHMNNAASPISVIFGADSFSDAIVLGHYMTNVSEYDTMLIDQVTAIRDEIEELRNSINRDLTDQETLEEEYEILKEQATLLVKEAQSHLSYAQAEQVATQAELDALRLEMERAQEEINYLMANWRSDIEYVGGNFRWPVPRFTWISSPYGWRTLYGQKSFHAGIDIAGSGIYGAGVVASNDGWVSTVVYGSSGYGYYVIVDHGGGWMTLYGHLSAIYVSKDEEVKQGNVIGAVGSTGNSTGPHLHFEIRNQGEKLDPMTILQTY